MPPVPFFVRPGARSQTRPPSAPARDPKRDPWVLLRRLKGLRGASVQLVFDKQPVSVSDAHFRAVEAGTMPDGADEAFRQGVACALFISELDAEDIAQVVHDARRGRESAQRTFQALVLWNLVKQRAAAERLVARLLDRDPSALDVVRALQRAALSPGPQQPRARVSAYLVAEAMSAAKAAATGKAPTPADEPTPPLPQDDAEAEAVGEDPAVEAVRNMKEPPTDRARADAARTKTQAPADASAIGPERAP